MEFAEELDDEETVVASVPEPEVVEVLEIWLELVDDSDVVEEALVVVEAVWVGEEVLEVRVESVETDVDVDEEALVVVVVFCKVVVEVLWLEVDPLEVEVDVVVVLEDSVELLEVIVDVDWLPVDTTDIVPSLKFVTYMLPFRES